MDVAPHTSSRLLASRASDGRTNCSPSLRECAQHTHTRCKKEPRYKKSSLLQSSSLPVQYLHPLRPLPPRPPHDYLNDHPLPLDTILSTRTTQTTHTTSHTVHPPRCSMPQPLDSLVKNDASSQTSACLSRANDKAEARLRDKSKTSYRTHIPARGAFHIGKERCDPSDFD